MKYCPLCEKEYTSEILYCSLDATKLEFRNLSNSATASLIGTTIDGKVLLESEIGHGGMGTVYKATHILLNRTVAVKILRPEIIGNNQAANRFLREARTAASINHPHVVGVYDVGLLDNGGAYIILEFISGESLRSYLNRQGSVPLDIAFQVIREVCSGVDAAHCQGIIHRDLKPENIMIAQSGPGVWNCKVLDFGLAKFVEESDSIINLTGAGEILGTPVYMSPEHCDGLELEVRSDIYSLGIIFYEMLVGHPPFTGRVVSVLTAHVQKKPTPIHEENHEIPIGISRAILSALEKNKTARPATVRDFYEKILQAYKSVYGEEYFVPLNQKQDPFQQLISKSLSPTENQYLVNNSNLVDVEDRSQYDTVFRTENIVPIIKNETTETLVSDLNVVEPPNNFLDETIRNDEERNNKISPNRFIRYTYIITGVFIILCMGVLIRGQFIKFFSPSSNIEAPKVQQPSSVDTKQVEEKIPENLNSTLDSDQSEDPKIKQQPDIASEESIVEKESTIQSQKKNKIKEKKLSKTTEEKIQDKPKHQNGNIVMRGFRKIGKIFGIKRKNSNDRNSNNNRDK